MLDKLYPNAPSEPLSPAVIGDMLRLLDLSVIGAVGLAVYFGYVYSDPPGLSAQYLVTVAIGVLAAGLIFQWLGVYAGDFLLAKGMRSHWMIVAFAITFAVLLTAAFALKISSFYSRIWLISWFIGSVGLLLLVRLFLSDWVQRQAAQNAFANRTVIVGVGEQGRRLLKHLEQVGAGRVRVLGMIDDIPGPDETAEPTASQPSGHLGGHLGGMDDLAQMIRQGGVDEVLIALPWDQEARVQAVVQRLATMPVHIRLALDLVGYHFIGRGLTHIGHLPMINILSRPISGWSQVHKSIEDRVLAFTFIALLALPMAAIALAIKFHSPGPVLFKQKRLGFNDTPFELWKFRTMHAHMADPDCLVQATRDDPRVTRLGRFLRRTSLDELPQLFNVLRGDMSIVGPRPHAASTKAQGYFFDDIVDSYAARHRVKPGITGWAQVNGWRGETDTVDKIQKRVEHDLYYIDNWSIWLDFLIIAKTILVLFRGEKAY
ncbi:MAG: undecaprenyl-phosphate glucose phosphotransferase [Alphaproteobacteria bacterium]|nr:undecaprenyl-phosphate glucose phosphotransferase [Alphaproteobacteria bacterium]